MLLLGEQGSERSVIRLFLQVQVMIPDQDLLLKVFHVFFPEREKKRKSYVGKDLYQLCQTE